MLIPFINLITLGKVKDSIDNVEQWMNVANAVFIEDQTFIFSYGPLFWLVTRVSEYYNAWNYYLSISFLIFFYSFVIYLIFSLIYKTQGYLYFSLIFICFFSFYSLKSLLFLWPLIFLFHQQLMSERNRQFNMRLCFALGSMAGMFLYIRFFMD
jgi:hypothetical protein